jgi:hypothetical protein
VTDLVEEDEADERRSLSEARHHSGRRQAKQHRIECHLLLRERAAERAESATVV